MNIAHNNMKSKLYSLAPCGVFCEACPSFEKTCLGCPANAKSQKRISKWSCQIRSCCYNEKQLDFCALCDDFPCTLIHKRLIKPHPKNFKYKYRHEISEVAEKLKSLGVDKYYEWIDDKWSCPYCGGRVVIYDYECSQCGEKVIV
jgi:hypothetical protein